MMYTSQLKKFDPYDWFCGPVLHLILELGLKSMCNTGVKRYFGFIFTQTPIIPRRSVWDLDSGQRCRTLLNHTCSCADHNHTHSTCAWEELLFHRRLRRLLLFIYMTFSEVILMEQIIQKWKPCNHLLLYVFV